MIDQRVQLGRLSNFLNVHGSGLIVSVPQTRLDHVGGVLLNTQFADLVRNLIEYRPAYVTVPLLDDFAHCIVSIRI